MGPDQYTFRRGLNPFKVVRPRYPSQAALLLLCSIDQFSSSSLWLAAEIHYCVPLQGQAVWTWDERDNQYSQYLPLLISVACVRPAICNRSQGLGWILKTLSCHSRASWVCRGCRCRPTATMSRMGSAASGQGQAATGEESGSLRKVDEQWGRQGESPCHFSNPSAIFTFTGW